MKMTVNWKWFADRLRAMNRSQADLARYLGIAPPRITDVKKGSRRFSVTEVHKIASFFNCPLTEVTEALGLPASYAGERMLLSGIIDERGMVVLYGDDDGKPLEEIRSPVPGYQGKVVKVVGFGMEPRFRDGELLFISNDRSDPAELIGEEVVARLASGDLVVMQLERGTSEGRYTLLPLMRSMRPMIDVRLDAVYEIEFRAPRPRRR